MPSARGLGRRLPISLVTHDLAAGTLALWGEVAVSEIALWALYAWRRLLSARVAAFVDFLREAFPHGSPDELAGYVAG
jgi:DNA-binding transcriptional LysR family regulator